jgi:hypothetical protein
MIMGRVVTVILLTLLTSFALATEAVKQKELVEGEIININEEYSFIIINLGKTDGVNKGSTLDVYQDAKRIAELEVIKVRDSFAAAEIIKIEPGTIVKVGDKVILPKEVREIEKRKELKSAVIEKGTIYSKELTKTATDIHADKEVVWFYLIQTLRDYGFIITNSNKTAGLISARKNLQLSLAREIWADIKGNTDYEIILSAKTISKGEKNTSLMFKVNGSYKRGGKHQLFSIGRKNKLYREIGEIIEKVKEQAER